MDCGRVSPIRSLVELCMKQVVTVCVNSTEPVEMSMNERLVIFEKLQTMHQLRKDTLRILVNEPSRHFLNRYNEVYFSKQPIEDECIQLIYQMLPTESEMETSKKKIQIDLSYCLQLSNPTIIPDTTRDKHSIRGISLRGCKCLKNLDFLRNFCRPDSLQFIDLSQCWSLSSSQIGDIGNFFHKLKGITLNYCSKLEDEDIIKIIENNESLESISLVGCGKITSKTLNVISNMALPLSNLSLGRSRKISIASFLKLLIICGESIRTLRMPPQCKNPWTLISLPYFCPKLNALELENIEMSWLMLLRYPTEQQLAKFVSQATEGTDDESFLFWKEKMEKLFRGLPIDQQHEIGARYLSKLARLNLTSVHWDNEVAEEIFPFCSLLHDVSIHGCRTIGSSTFDGLARSGCKITSLDCGYMLSNCPAKEGIGMLDCTELRYLYCGSSFRDDIIHSWLNKSPNSCVKLKSIQIHWSDNVRDSGMTKLLDRCGKSLLWLEIGLCYFLTVKTFESLASFCPNLLELDIRSIPNVTDEIIDMICIKCPNIEQLNISHDSELTDCAMETIAKNLPRLSSLQLDNLTKITDHGIRTLASFVRERMKCLSVAGIRALTDLSLQYIGNYHPNISSLNLSSTRFSAKGMCNLLNSLHFIQELNLSTQPNVNDQVVACACSNPFLQTLELSECPLLTNDCITSLAKCSRLESLSLANSVNVQGSLLPILERNDGHISLTTPANAALSRW